MPPGRLRGRCSSRRRGRRRRRRDLASDLIEAGRSTTSLPLRQTRSPPRRPSSRCCPRRTRGRPRLRGTAVVDGRRALGDWARADRGDRARPASASSPSRPRGRRAVGRCARSSASPTRSATGIDDAMATARTAGIQMVIVTGDHPETAAAIAARGRPGRRRGSSTGEQLATWDDDRLAEELPSLHIVARSTPDQKERLVGVARRGPPDRGGHRRRRQRRAGAPRGRRRRRDGQRHGRREGGLGPRPRRRLVRTLMFGLAEGRRIVDNVQKGLVFLVSTHVALLGFILIATIYRRSASRCCRSRSCGWSCSSTRPHRSPSSASRPSPTSCRRPPRRTDPAAHRSLLGGIAVAGGFSAVAALVVMVDPRRRLRARRLARLHDARLCPGRPRLLRTAA